MGHALNHGLTTNAKGASWDQLRVTFDGSGNATIAEDCGAGLVTSIAHTGTGIYTFQMAKPYPPKAVVVQPNMSITAANGAYRNARYKTNSYDATAGTFVVFVSDATPAAADPASGDEMHVDIVSRRYTANP